MIAPPDLNKALRRTRSLADAARSAQNPELALAYLEAADRVIQVDDFPYQGPGIRGGGNGNEANH
jgi:acyl-CoA dehydrogenase